MMPGTRETFCTADELKLAVQAMLDAGGRMQMAWGWFPEPGSVEVCYLGSPAAYRPFALWRVRPEQGSLPSLAASSPMLGWYEREITDLCGVRFDGHPEPYPLLFEGVPFAPLDPAHLDDEASGTRAPMRVAEVLGADVQQLPSGPVRAGVVESSQYQFFYLGENILRYHIRLFFKHRGLERRFAGLSATAGTVLAERISGIGSVAHSLAYCRAVEVAAKCEVPERAQRLRVLLAELERLYNHLYYFGHLADTTTLKVGHAEGVLLAERVKQMLGRITGSRFGRNVLTPGGLRRDLAVPGDFAAQLESLHKDAWYYLTQLERTTSFLDRILTTGVLDRQTAFDQGATGPIERASGLDRDLRRDHPYTGYDDYEFQVPVREDGDAYARARIRSAEIVESFAILHRVLWALTSGEVRAPCTPAPLSEGLGWAESPRGSLLYAIHVDTEGRLARVKVKSPSYSNWRVFPFTVHGSNMMDYAINEASFGLSVAGCDR
ncbi:MAG: nickel-dependent hydrogenase large subunit [Rhodanobacteraceae bacterium]